MRGGGKEGEREGRKEGEREGGKEGERGWHFLALSARQKWAGC